MVDNRKTVIVADDEPSIRSLIRDVLGEEKYAFREAVNGREALELFKEEKADLLITDVKMPVMDGFELLTEVKILDPETGVIVLTGFGSIEDGVNAMKLGAGDYLLKPFDSSQLVAAVEKSLREKELNNRIRRLEKLLAFEKVSKMTGTDTDLPALFNKIMDLALRSSSADSGAIMLVDPETKIPSVVSSEGLSPETIERMNKAIAERFSAPASTEVQLDCLMNNPHFKGLNNDELGNSVCAPLVYMGKALGMLNVNKSGGNGNFSQEDIGILSVYAASMAASIEHAIMHAEIIGKNKELTEKTRKLEELSKIKSEFVSHVSHELRTPLTAIKGAMDLLNYGAGAAKFDPLDSRMINVAIRNSERMVALIDDLLDFSRMESGTMKVSKSTFVLNDVMTETLSELEPIFQKKNLTSGFNSESGNVEITGDRDRLKQAVVNIIGNAIKYTEKGGVKVALRTEGRLAVVDVADTGCGIPEADRSKIFERFYRANNLAKTTTEGFGLGLALTRFIIEELHKGRIWFDSEEGKGTIFHFSIPLGEKK